MIGFNIALNSLGHMVTFSFHGEGRLKYKQKTFSVNINRKYFQNLTLIHAKETIWNIHFCNFMHINKLKLYIKLLLKKISINSAIFNKGSRNQYTSKETRHLEADLFPLWWTRSRLKPALVIYTPCKIH